MVKKSRLSRYRGIEDSHRRRRLDLVMRKRAMVQDIMALAGESKLEQLEGEVCQLGDNLEDVLLSMSPTMVADLHKRLIDFEGKPENLPHDDW